MENSLILLNRLEWLIRTDCLLRSSRNAVALVTLYDNSSKFENIDLTIKKNNLEIQIVKEYLINPKLEDLVKTNIRDSLLDVRILDLRFRSKSYVYDKSFEDLLRGYELFMFLFSDYDLSCCDSNVIVCNKFRSKFRDKFGSDFGEFIEQLK